MPVIIFLLLVASFAGGCVVTRWATRARTDAILAQNRAAMADEIRRWKDAADRANSETQRVTREAAAWAEGHARGRQDLIAMIPLLLAVKPSQNGAVTPLDPADPDHCRRVGGGRAQDPLVDRCDP